MPAHMRQPSARRGRSSRCERDQTRTGADARPIRMARSPTSRDRTLQALRKAAATCTQCDLYKRATQTVFGEGSPRSAIVLVGEQPGHEEDLAGRPFIGPAGRLLEEALETAELD